MLLRAAFARTRSLHAAEQLRYQLRVGLRRDVGGAGGGGAGVLEAAGVGVPSPSSTECRVLFSLSFAARGRRGRPPAACLAGERVAQRLVRGGIVRVDLSARRNAAAAAASPAFSMRQPHLNWSTALRGSISCLAQRGQCLV